jgi:hypothetical protein
MVSRLIFAAIFVICPSAAHRAPYSRLCLFRALPRQRHQASRDAAYSASVSRHLLIMGLAGMLATQRSAGSQRRWLSLSRFCRDRQCANIAPITWPSSTPSGAGGRRTAVPQRTQYRLGTGWRRETGEISWTLLGTPPGGASSTSATRSFSCTTEFLGRATPTARGSRGLGMRSPTTAWTRSFLPLMGN